MQTVWRVFLRLQGAGRKAGFRVREFLRSSNRWRALRQGANARVRSVARAAKVSKSTVQRIRSRNEIKPHRTETFKTSKDPQFKESFGTSLVSISIRPSVHWFCVATRIVSIRLWNAPQPALPLNTRHCRMRTHDYIRQRTSPSTSFFDSLCEILAESAYTLRSCSIPRHFALSYPNHKRLWPPSHYTLISAHHSRNWRKSTFAETFSKVTFLVD